MKGAGNSFRLRAVVVLMGSVALTAGCGSDASEVTIHRVDPNRDNTFNVPASGSLAEDGSYLVKRDNPVVEGSVLLDDPQFTTLSPSRTAVCCDRVLLNSSPPVFYGGASHAFAAIPDRDPLHSVETGREASVWGFRSPAIHMPADGSPVSLTLSRSSGRENELPVTQTIRLRLDSGTIVLPVHVHEFVNDRSSFVRVGEQRVRAIFDGPALTTTSVIEHDPHERRNKQTTTSEDVTDPNEPPDRLWDDGGIQFRLSSYETIPQREGLERQLINQEEAAQGFGGACRPDTRVARYHAQRRSTPGIHIYFGGTIDSNMLGGDFAGGACGAHSACRDNVDVEDLILIDGWRSFRTPNTIAHELGHFLGLEHTTVSRSCGALLLINPDDSEEQHANLMGPAARGHSLTAAQIDRARRVACAAMHGWNVAAVGCR